MVLAKTGVLYAMLLRHRCLSEVVRGLVGREPFGNSYDGQVDLRRERAVGQAVLVGQNLLAYPG